MGFTVSVLVQVLEQFDPSAGGLNLHGANLSVAGTFRNLLKNPRVEAMEIFLTPDQYQRKDDLVAVAQKLLPPERVGKGSLRFYSVYDIPEIWADGIPRVLLCLDPQLWARNRYLRDRFSQAPTIVSCQTHGMGDPLMYLSLLPIGLADPVPFDLLTCLSNACRTSFERTFDGFLSPAGSPPRCRMEVFGNVVDIRKFVPHSREEQHRARLLLGLPEEGTIALFLGRLSPNSKADLMPLLRQFAQVSRSSDYLVIVGPENLPGYSAKIVELGEQLGLGNRLIVRDSAEPWSTPIFYGAADLYVFPSDNVQECLANTVLEAMASGLPVIASDWDGIRDTVVDGETGYLIPTYFTPGLDRTDAMSPAVHFMTNMLMLSQSAWVDAPKLGGRLKELLQSPVLRKSMGQAGRSRIEENYTPKTIHNRLLDVWEECLSAAAEEPSTARAQRREKANAIGLPIPSLHAFSGYATGTLDLDRTKIRLSDLGAKVVAGQSTLAFYDETLPLIRPEIVDTLFRTLSNAGMTWQTMSDVVSHCALTTGRELDHVILHLALLLKRDMLELDSEGPKSH